MFSEFGGRSPGQALAPEIHGERSRAVGVVRHGFVSVGTEEPREEGDAIEGIYLVFVRG